MFTHSHELKEEKFTYPPSAPMRLHPEAFKLPAQLTHTDVELQTFLKEIYKQEPEYKFLNSESKFHEPFKQQMASLCKAFYQYAKEYGLDVIELSKITNYPAHLVRMVEGKPTSAINQIKILLEEFVYLIQKKTTADKTKIREELQKRERENKEPFNETQVEAQYELEVEEINAIELRKPAILLMLVPQLGQCDGGELGNLDIALSYLRGDNSLEYLLCALRTENYTDFEKYYIKHNPSIHKQAIHVSVVLRTYLNKRQFGILSKLGDFKDAHADLSKVTSAITNQLDLHNAETYQLRSITDRILEKWLELFRKKTLGDEKEQAILTHWVPYNQKLINLANDILTTWEIYPDGMMVFDREEKSSQLRFSPLRFKQLFWQFCQKKDKFVYQADWQMTENFLGKYRLFHPKDVRVLDLAWLEDSNGNLVLLSDLSAEERQAYFIDSIVKYGVPDPFQWITPSPKLFDVLKTDDDYLALATNLSKNKQWIRQIPVLSAIFHERPHHFMSMLSAVGEEIAFEWLDQFDVDFYWCHPHHLNHSLARDLIDKAKGKDLDFVLKVVIQLNSQKEKLRKFQDDYGVIQLPIPYDKLLELAQIVKRDGQFIFKWYLKQYFPGNYYDVIVNEACYDYATAFLKAHQEYFFSFSDGWQEICRHLQRGEFKPLQKMNVKREEIYIHLDWAYKCQQRDLLNDFYDQIIHTKDDFRREPHLFWMVAFNRQEKEHKEVEALLAVQDLNVNEVGFYGCTPLQMASTLGLTDWVKTLCEFKSNNIDAANKIKETALIYAARKGHLPIIQCLLEHKADVNVARIDGATALIIAAQEGHLPAVQCLLQHKAQVNTVMKGGVTALHKAVIHGRLPIIQCLLEHKADVNASWSNGETALIIATIKGNLPVIQYLLEHKAEVNASCSNGETALIIAAIKGNLPVIQYLLEHKAEVNASCSKGETALMFATINGNLPIIQCLLEHKADVNAALIMGQTALYLAAQEENIEVIKILGDADANPTLRCNNKTPYQNAHSPRAKLLLLALELKHKIKNQFVESKEPSAESKASSIFPFFRSSIDLSQKLAILQQLLEGKISREKFINLIPMPEFEFNEAPWDYFYKEADSILNISKVARIQALMIAVQNGDLSIVKSFLEKYKINVNSIRRTDGATALMAAADKGHLPIVQLLLEKLETNVNAVHSNGATALHFALENNHLLVTQCLLKHNANVDAAREDDVTALHIAVDQGNIAVVKTLLDANANPLLRWNNKRPYQIASDPRIKQLLLAAELKHEIKKQSAKSEEKLAFDLPPKISLLQQLLDGIISRETFLKQVPTPETEFNEDPWKYFYKEADSIFKINKAAVFRRLMRAAQRDDLSDVKLEHKADVNAARRSDNATVLHAAAEAGSLSTVQYLLEQKAQVNAAKKNGVTALYIAAAKGHLPIVKCLLQVRNIDVNAVDIDGATALHVAALKGHIDIVKALLDANADPALRWDHRTPYQVARDPRIKQLFLAAKLKHKLENQFVESKWSPKESKEISTSQFFSPSTHSTHLSERLALLQQLLDGSISKETFLEKIPTPKTVFKKTPLYDIYKEADGILNLSNAAQINEQGNNRDSCLIM